MTRVGAFGWSLLVVLARAATRPDVLYILLDDWGWGNAGWHHPSGYTDVQSPNMDALVREGVELNRHYAYKMCGPSRSAIQSGRNPIHVNVLNLAIDTHNPNDPVSGFDGIPRNMTGIGEHLLRAGYDTHFYGKWHAGMATPQHTPHGRGYRSSLSYLGSSNDFWTNRFGFCSKGNEMVPVVDLWNGTGPAYGQNNTPTCSQKHQKGCVYEDQLFLDRVIDAIDHRDAATPQFIFWSPHIAHVPLEVPDSALKRFSFIHSEERQKYHAMVYWIDEAIGKVVQKLKDSGSWDNSVVIVHSDNGGPIYGNGCCGANNWPLKGGKRANWEGGIRVNSFVTGGALPEKVRGTKQEGLMAAWDWYATIAGLAGVDPTDHKAAEAGLPPIDSKDMWPLISGQVQQSPRTELALGDAQDKGKASSKTLVGGLIQGRYKVLVGNLSESGWTDSEYPSNTTWRSNDAIQSCGRDANSGCLFDVVDDPGEHFNLAKERPDILQRMLARVAEIEKTAFSPYRGSQHSAFCQHVLDVYRGFTGPFVDTDYTPVQITSGVGTFYEVDFSFPVLQLALAD